MLANDFTLPFAATTVLLGLLLVCLFAFLRLRRSEQHLAHEAERLAGEAAGLAAARSAADIARAAAETRAGMLGESLATLRQQFLTESERREGAEKAAALAAQQVVGMQKRVDDWEQTKAEGVKAAQAASLAVAQELSSKLLADHKRENAAAEERVKTHAAALHGQVNTLAEAVASLNDQVKKSDGTVDTLMRALTSPGGAGQFAEIGLENTLKSFGLESGRDFKMQYSVGGGADGSRLRPDAVVFLPGDALLVIDSKASKFFVDQAAATDAAGEAEAAARMAQTMKQHLRALADRDYQGAIRDANRQAGRSGANSHIINVMYVSSESQLERLLRADPEFIKEAQVAQIHPAGPAGLAAMISFAKVAIDRGRQAENQERIVAAVQALLDSVAVALGHADKVGRSLQTAAEAFKQMAASVNGRLLPRVRSLVQLGVRPAGNKPLPRPLPSYEVVRHDTQATIEGDAEEVAEPARELAPPTH